MRRRQLKWLWARLAQLQGMRLTRDALLMKLGSAKTNLITHEAQLVSQWGLHTGIA
jgi:hypothetical protein